MAEEQPTNTQAEMNEEEIGKLARFLAESGSAPTPEDKYNVHLFLHRVATADDTTKVGNLDETELGKPLFSVRALKDMALISRDLIGNAELQKSYNDEAEIITATSLSKEGFLVKQATTTTRQIADVTKKKSAQNKGWFKKKEDTQSEDKS